MTTIAQKIEGNTKLNSLTLKELETVLPQLQKFVGKRILKQTGFSKMFHVEHFKEKSLRVYFRNSYGSLILYIDTNIQVGEYSCEYFKYQINIGVVKDGILTEIESLENISITYNLNETYNENTIKDILEEVEGLELQARRLKNSISKFL